VKVLLAALALSGVGGWAARGQTLIAPAIQSVSSQLSYCCNRKAAYLVDGSGLTAGTSGILGNSDSTHGNIPDGTMWVSDTGDVSPILVFNLGNVFNLQTTRIWNYNESCCTAFGPKNIEVSVSADNFTWTVLGTNTLAQAGGGAAEPAQNLSTVAAGVRYVRLHLLDNYGGALFGLSEVRFVGMPFVPYGGMTLLTNSTSVQLANTNQLITFLQGSDGKFHLTTFVWDGANWRSFFDAQHPLIEGAAFGLEPTLYEVLTNLEDLKVVRFRGLDNSPLNSFQIRVSVQSGSPLVRFEIDSHFFSDVTLTTPQPTVGVWMNRPSAQMVMYQGPPSATRGAFAVGFNFGFPAAYLYDQNEEAAVFFDMTPMTWMAPDGVDRFYNVQARPLGNGTQTGLGLYPYGLSGSRIRAGDMAVPFYLYAAWRPQAPVQQSDMLDKMLEVFQPLHSLVSVLPSNTLDGGAVTWQGFAQRTIADLMVQNVTYGDRTNEPYTDAPLALVSLPNEMIVHPSFPVANASDALNAWNFATINHSLVPSVLYARQNTSTQVQHFVQLKKDALPRFYNSDSRLISSGTQQPPFVFNLELSWQTLVYYQELLAIEDALAKEDFNPAIMGRFLMGLEGLIQYARQVNYVFSVYYDPFTKQPVAFQENTGLGAIREPWSVGSYCYVMLGAYDITADAKYLTEATNAMTAFMNTLSYTEANNYYTATYTDPMQMPVMELMGNSYGTIAARKLYELTGDPAYLRYQRDFLNVLLRMTFWFEDETDPISHDLRNLGLFIPFVGAPTVTSWETAEANLCLGWLLKYDPLNSRASLLARLSNLNRIHSFYFYPATFSTNVRNLNPNLRRDVGQYFPTENMYMLEFPEGSGGSPNETAIYMTGLALWNSWIYESLAAASNHDILVLNLASLDGYEESLRSARRQFLVYNPTSATINTRITNQALSAGTYKVTLTDAAGGVISSTNLTQAQLIAAQAVTLAPQQILYLTLMNTNAANMMAEINSYRSAGKRLSYAYQLLQVTARDSGIGTNVQQLQAVFVAAQQAYQAGDYAAAYGQADQIVTNLLSQPALTLSITPSTSRLAVPVIASFSSFYGSRSPTNLVNASGLTAGPSGILGGVDSTHDTDVEGAMWYSDPYITPPDTNPVVTFDLGSVCDLQTTRIWQYNQPGGFTIYGAKDIAISVSLDNTNFSAQSTISPARAGGSNGEPAQDFPTPAKAIQYVRFHILDTFGGSQASGLSEVRFVSASTGVDITVNGIQGLHYRVEYRDSLDPADSWELLQDIPGLNATTMVVHDLAPIQTQRFYRAVQVQ